MSITFFNAFMTTLLWWYLFAPNPVCKYANNWAHYRAPVIIFSLDGCFLPKMEDAF